jgi:protease-4
MPDDDKEYMQRLLGQLHQQFIQVVKEGRGGKLKDDAQIFSGLFWSGEEALRLGLIDGLGSSSFVAREIIGAEKIVDFTSKEDWVKKLAEHLGTTAVQGLTGLGGNAALPLLR